MDQERLLHIHELEEQLQQLGQTIDVTSSLVDLSLIEMVLQEHVVELSRPRDSRGVTFLFSNISLTIVFSSFLFIFSSFNQGRMPAL